MPTKEDKQLEELDEELDSDERPPLKRDHILQAKKPFLIDLCKAYDLDPSGTKEELRERLLSTLEDEEKKAAPPEAPPAIAVEKAEPPKAESVAEAPIEVEPSSQPVVKETPMASATLLLVEEPAKPTEPRPSPEPAPMPGAPVVLIGQGPAPSPAVTAAPEAAAAPPMELPATAAAEAPQAEPILARRVDNPCPTCGRELDYVLRYDRWYCYRCKAYAPASTVKHVCPSCGATLRWIQQYERWWCDGCRRYAAADLPAPKPGTVTASPAPAEVVVPSVLATPVSVAATAAIPEHKHRSPAGGIGLIGLGLATWLVYEVLVEFPAFLGMTPIATVPPDVGFLLRFSGFLLVALGAIAGLASARSRA